MKVMNVIIVQFQKKSLYPPYGRSSEFLWGGGLKSQNFIAKYETKLEFPGGRGVNEKPYMGGVWTIIFWKCTLLLFEQ